MTLSTRTRHLAAAFTLVSFGLLALGSSSSKETGATGGGCKTDHDCKGSRVCQSGQCVDPQGASAAQQPQAQPQPQPQPQAQPQPQGPNPQMNPTPAPAPKPQGPRAVRVSDPPGGCMLGGVIYEPNGQVWGCDGGGNWCANSGPLPGGCPR